MSAGYVFAPQILTDEAPGRHGRLKSYAFGGGTKGVIGTVGAI